MDQVSRPLQIALLAALGFAALWFVALRPKAGAGGGGSSSPPAVKAPPANRGGSLPGGLAKSVDKARTAQAQENGAAARSDKLSNSVNSAPAIKTGTPRPGTSAAQPRQATPRTATATPATGGLGSALASPSVFASAPAMAVYLTIESFRAGGVGALVAPTTAGASRATAVTPAPRAPRAARSRIPAPTASPVAVQQALAAGKVVVLLFWNHRSSDDRAVRDELAHVGTYGGRALIAAAPVRDVSRYGEVTTGVQVLQSPTVVVVDRQRRASVLVGYTDRAEIGQAVLNALAGR